MNTTGHQTHSLKSTILALSCLLASCVGSLCAQTPEQPKPGPEHKKLEVSVGEWGYEGEAKDSPFGPAGKFRGKTTSRMVLNGFFRESRWEDKGDTGYIAQGIVLRGYDPVTKTYVDYGFENDGSVTPGSTTVSGNTWTGTGTRTDSKGKNYKMKSVMTFSSDGKTWTEKSEYSADNGQTWMTFYELTGKKVNK